MHEYMLEIKEALGHSSDFKIRNIEENGVLQATVFYIDGLVNAGRLEEHVIKPLVHNSNASLNSTEIVVMNSSAQAVQAIVQGKAVVLQYQADTFNSVDVTMLKERPVAESLSERNPLGSLVGFTEKSNTNISIMRGILKTPDLTVETFPKGTLTPTTISILYMRNIVDSGILQEVKKRLDELDVKYILESAIVEEALAKNSWTIFPLTSSTEAPDIAASTILEGKVVVFVDNSPQAILCPTLFVSYFQSPVEYYGKYGRFLNRIIMLVSFIVATYGPAIYILLEHSELMSKEVNKLLYPQDMILSPFVATIILMIILKILVDGMFKVNKNLVTFFALISTVLISENMLNIKMLSPFCLCVIAFSFVTATLFQSRGLTPAMFMLMCVYLFVAKLTGPLGVIVLTTIVFIHIVMLKSITVPYLSPLIPLKPKELRDVFFRSNLKKLINSKHSYTKKGKRK